MTADAGTKSIQMGRSILRTFLPNYDSVLWSQTLSRSPGGGVFRFSRDGPNYALRTPTELLLVSAKQGLGLQPCTYSRLRLEFDLWAVGAGLDPEIVLSCKGQRQRSRPEAALNTACIIVPPVISSQQMRYHPILVFGAPVS